MALSMPVSVPAPTFRLALAILGAALCPFGSASAQGEAARQAGIPANICRELASFAHPPTPESKASEGGGQGATAVAAPSPDKAPQKPAAGGEAQQNSGQSGPISNADQGSPGARSSAGKDAAPTGADAKAEAKPPTAPAAPAAPKMTLDVVAEIDAVTGHGEIAACRDHTQKLRRAGYVLSPALIALAALDLRFLERAAQPTP